jgi:hypothetical protein
VEHWLSTKAMQAVDKIFALTGDDERRETSTGSAQAR